MVVPLQDTPNLTVQNVKDSTKAGWKNSSDIQYYSDVKLNLTGIPEAYEVIDTMTNPENNESTKSVDLFLGQQGKAAYFISFIGPSTTFSNTQDLYNNVLPTIQIQ